MNSCVRSSLDGGYASFARFRGGIAFPPHLSSAVRPQLACHGQSQRLMVTPLTLIFVVTLMCSQQHVLSSSTLSDVLCGVGVGSVTIMLRYSVQSDLVLSALSSCGSAEQYFRRGVVGPRGLSPTVDFKCMLSVVFPSAGKSAHGCEYVRESSQRFVLFDLFIFNGRP